MSTLSTAYKTLMDLTDEMYKQKLIVRHLAECSLKDAKSNRERKELEELIASCN